MERCPMFVAGLNIVKMSTPPKPIYRCNEIAIK